MTCAWGAIPVSQLDKGAKHKVVLRGGNPLCEAKIDRNQVHQEKKGFDFLKKLTQNSTDEALLIVNIKPFAKFQELTQLHISMLPSICLVSKRLLSFVSAFRVYSHRRLAKS